MSDERLQSLYRRLTASHTDASAIDADVIAEALQRHGYPDTEGTPLDRIAASADYAEVLRVALALAPEATALSREVADLRRPQRLTSTPARRWLALAAGVGGLAVVFAMLRGGPQPGLTPVATLPSDTILSVSFESAPSDRILSVSFESRPGNIVDIEEAKPIFRGDFDS